MFKRFCSNECLSYLGTKYNVLGHRNDFKCYLKSLILELFDFIFKVSFRVDATRFAPNRIKKTNLELSYQYKSKNVSGYTIRLHETGFRIFENIVISDIFDS